MNNEKIIVKKVQGGSNVGGGYVAEWGSIHGVGFTHMQALKALHYSRNFLNGSIERPQGLPFDDIEFEDRCQETACICKNRQKK